MNRSLFVSFLVVFVPTLLFCSIDAKPVLEGGDQKENVLIELEKNEENDVDYDDEEDDNEEEEEKDDDDDESDLFALMEEKREKREIFNGEEEEEENDEDNMIEDEIQDAKKRLMETDTLQKPPLSISKEESVEKQVDIETPKNEREKDTEENEEAEEPIPEEKEPEVDEPESKPESKLPEEKVDVSPGPATEAASPENPIKGFFLTIGDSLPKAPDWFKKFELPKIDWKSWQLPKFKPDFVPFWKMR